MVKTLMLSGALVLGASSILPAQLQSVRWNDRPTTSWDDEAPKVRVTIEGDRAVGYLAPLRVRFEVSDNAFVTVVRVDGEGRMTILYPQSRNQRAAVRANQVYYVRNTRLGGDVSFLATDVFGGYVFALASYQPLDFASFENRDFDRAGGWSQFTMANRNISRRPDMLIDRFAARVLWSLDTPYDYDVDYYTQAGPQMNALALCGTNAFGNYYGYGYSRRTLLSQLSSFERMSYPYYSMCNSLYDRYMCFSWLSYSIFASCLNNPIVIARAPSVGGNGGPVGGIPLDSAGPNEGVIRGGLFTPAPVPIPTDPQNGTLARETGGGRFDQVKQGDDLDGITSIPARATRKMKDDDARRERSGTEATGTSRTGFDRAGATDRTDKVATADGGSAQPPSREPTKAKGAADPVRETTRSRTGFGSSGQTTGSSPSPTRDRDASSRPASKPATPAATPSLGGTSTTDKKKPPQE